MVRAQRPRIVDGGLEGLLIVFLGGDSAKVEPDAVDFVRFFGRAMSLSRRSPVSRLGMHRHL